jgi:TolB-like protein/serine/threonine protein kinase/thioredoxin-like negative regulator of GroEL
MERSVASGVANCSVCGQSLNSRGECLACLIRAALEESITEDGPKSLVFGDFEVVRRDDGSLFELGHGAMGVTYLAVDNVLRRKVALKIIELPQAARTSYAVRGRFLREARAAACLRHPNVAAVFQFGASPSGRHCYYAMELIEGETLQERVHRDGPLNAKLVLEIAIQTVRALTAAAAQGLIHRDLKPGNIMLTRGDADTTEAEVKVIDFGLAKAIADAGNEMDLTAGGFVGTPNFASPEQFESGPIDVRADIYSLGVTLWFALTGKTPFVGHSIEEIRSARRSNALPLEQLEGARVPSRLKSLLKSMLAFEPAARPGIQELATSLRRCSAKEIALEIAHVLFIDIVGYSKLSINEQQATVDELTQVVLSGEQFQKADAADGLIKIASGDGMALVFYTSPEAPVRCAIEISRALKDHPPLQVRMGIHSGPASGVVDVTGRANLTGAGLNMANRVMECGDAGHILLSKHVAEDLEEFEEWRPLLHDLGTIEVKHGVRLHVVNLYNESLGNAAIPKKIAAANRSASRRAKSRALLTLFALALVIAAITLFLLYRGRLRESGFPAGAKSIAVLPFEDLSQTKDQQYFCDGMSEEILDALAKVEGLRVVARTSSFSFKGENVDVGQVGKRLGVENVLEGSLRREGNRVRITTKLSNTRNGFQLWSETYERELQGVFALQDEITRAVVDALKLKLALSLPVREQRNTEAYDLYLQGLYLSNKGSEKELREGLTFFQRALEKDPKLSRAWTGIAKIWFYLADVYVKPLEAYPESRAAALKAIELDDKDAEAHCYLAEAKRILDWDLPSEETELERALQLDPNSAPVNFFLALLPLFRGDVKEGLELVLKAEQLDPVSPIISYVTTAAYLADNRLDDAIVEGQRTQQLDPHYFYLDSTLAAAYREKGNFAEAIELYTKAQEETHLPSSGLAITYARMGRQIEARKILDQLVQERRTRYVSAQIIAAIYVGLGDKEEAFRWLELAATEHSGILQWIAFLPEFRPLRPDKRFPNLLRRIGVPHNSSVSITETSVSEIKDQNAQIHLSLRIGVKPRPNTQNGHVVRLAVSFYDLTKDGKMKPTDARTAYDWLTRDRDWTDPSPKFLAATYVRPKTQVASPEGRRYGGFTVHVYFDGQLQDARANPPELLNLFPAPDQVALPPNTATSPPH